MLEVGIRIRFCTRTLPPLIANAKSYDTLCHLSETFVAYTTRRPGHPIRAGCRMNSLRAVR